MNIIKKELLKLENKEHAVLLSRFFKCGKGEYGEGDRFLGLNVGSQRKLVAKYWNEVGLKEVSELVSDKYHECRLTGFFILVKKYQKAKTEDEKKEYFEFYLKNLRFVNNWDLVDMTAPTIVGGFLFDKDKKILYKFARSSNLWEKRISILSTFYFIREKKFDDSLKIAEILLNDKHDLIHKGVGWMLREIGNRDLETEERFLKKYYKKMPRTMLRYSIEKFPEKKRLMYLKSEI